MHRPWSTSVGEGSLNCEPGDEDSIPSVEMAPLEVQRPAQQPVEWRVMLSPEPLLPSPQRRGLGPLPWRQPHRRAASVSAVQRAASPERRPEPGRRRSGHRVPRYCASAEAPLGCRAAAPSAVTASSPGRRPDLARRQCEGQRQDRPQGEQQPRTSILPRHPPWSRPAVAPAGAVSPAPQLEPGRLQCVATWRHHYYCLPHRLRHRNWHSSMAP
mmetsp:Transcript_7392/g.20523  ORF Transcript_7392/g.20523 Transcript_7392/m.20523 type:complete len:214 (+) Transcript_7392:342-983(+)